MLITYYVLNEWLQRFAYKVAMEGWDFVAGTAISITIAFLTVSVQAMRLALMNPARSLRSE